MADVPSSRTPWLATAAMAILAIALGALFLRERSEHDDVAAASAEAHLQLANTQEQAADKDSIISALLEPDLQTATLAAPGRPPTARLYHNRTRNIVVVTAFDLPAAPTGRTYQLWGIAGSQSVSIGTFNTDPNRRAAVSFRVPLGARYQSSGISEEPTAGSPEPTTRPFAVGSWKTP